MGGMQPPESADVGFGLLRVRQSGGKALLSLSNCCCQLFTWLWDHPQEQVMKTQLAHCPRRLASPANVKAEGVPVTSSVSSGNLALSQSVLLAFQKLSQNSAWDVMGPRQGLARLP